jgi:hypothetical protein
VFSFRQTASFGPTRDWRKSLALMALVAGLGACGDEGTPDTPEAAVAADEDLKALVALPYLSWTTEEADPEKLGVTIWDTERAWSGLNLYTNDVNEAYLMDMSGRRLHTWTLPEEFTHCEHFELLPGGGIVVVCVGQGLVRLDRRSKVLWELDKRIHHDVAVVEDGSFWVPIRGRGRKYQGRRVGFDGLIRVSADGEILDRWRSWDHLSELQAQHGASHLDWTATGEAPKKTYDYYHLNSVEVLPETPLGSRDERFRAGNLLVCLRNVHLIAVLDQDTFAVTWSWGPGELSFPHMPTMLADGHVLVYDNGVDSERSRVLEIDPATDEILWSFVGDPPESFFSKRRGSNQRLPNGNTLIAESEKGRVFEVDRDGEVVWEFWNPEMRKGRRKRIYRFMRRAEDEVRELFRSRPR